jgi:hypothetical protein
MEGLERAPSEPRTEDASALAPRRSAPAPAAEPPPRRIDLGLRTIDGIACRGTRLVADRWHGESWESLDLRLAIYEERTDPDGTALSRVLEVSRSEPDPSLFADLDS